MTGNDSQHAAQLARAGLNPASRLALTLYSIAPAQVVKQPFALRPLDFAEGVAQPYRSTKHRNKKAIKAKHSKYEHK